MVGIDVGIFVVSVPALSVAIVVNSAVIDVAICEYPSQTVFHFVSHVMAGYRLTEVLARKLLSLPTTTLKAI